MNPSFLQGGLFGQIIYHVFECLPKLYKDRIFPDWRVRSYVYGEEPDFTIIPGLFDLNYSIVNTQVREIEFRDLRVHYVSVLGNQWEALSRIWNAYFRVPSRVIKRAD